MVKNLHGSAFIQLEFLSFFFFLLYLLLLLGVLRGTVSNRPYSLPAINLFSALYVSIRRGSTGRESSVKL